ncbi:hypothetical protein NFHSH190041_31370 [Shewanella sp. NFH-SH190041]|uniref:DUF3069 domain-containing protein n=1 Tax=Shewanella sp. NFH-SH190041 TaxID=2950245 RepID=UPI0021C33970|nr:DUF3069 domain-containing protein [Shewanella sp. NFH-SH190041]BDM65685.1 hypothetical protein NFHSH190041_31370 [Shewanella sp. NFH-SH190041]
MTAEYEQIARTVANNVAAKVMPLAQMPDNLKEAYADLTNQLLTEGMEGFSHHWDALPASARKLMDKAQFHGFFIAQSWLKLSMAGQQLAELADTDDAIAEKEYQGIFAQLIDDALKDSMKKLKKARTDRSLLNSFKQVMAD